MTKTPARKKSDRDALKTFGLYVFFYHMWEGFLSLFKDD